MSTYLVFAGICLAVAALALAADRFEASWIDRLLRPDGAGAPPATSGPSRPALRTVVPRGQELSRGPGHRLPRGVTDAEEDRP